MKGTTNNMIRRFFLLSAIAAVAVFGADNSLLSLVPADAKVAGGVQVTRTVASPFGQYVLSQMGQNNAHLQEFIDATGFDPRRDLQELVFASTGAPTGGQKGPGVVLARGVFNGPQILNAIKAKEPAGTLTTYRGVPLFDKNNHGVAIADGWLAIAGEINMVKAALDRRAGSGAASPLVTKAAAAGSRYDAWMVTNGVFVAPLPGKAGGSPLAGGLQGIVETSGGLTFGNNVQFSGEALTRSAQDAQALVDVVKFITSMVQLNASNPEAQKLQPLLSSLQVAAEGTTVRMSFSIAQGDLEQLMQPRKAGVRAASVRR